MGCFSFMCKLCDKPVLSNSSRGQEVSLFLLKEGKIIDSMHGEYDSYGRVFTEDLQNSIVWFIPWHKVCDLMWNSDKSNGIAAIHKKCLMSKLPDTRSEDDPNQGWGENWEHFGAVSKNIEI